MRQKERSVDGRRGTYEVREFESYYGQWGQKYADPQSLRVIASHRRWITSRLHALVIPGAFLARAGQPTIVATGDVYGADGADVVDGKRAVMPRVER